MATRWWLLAATLCPILTTVAAAESPSTEGTGQRKFFCNTGYSLESCGSHLQALRRVLETVDVAPLGEWTWVLVRSEDWKPILRRVGRDPDSPAFTILEKRQTFLEEALFAPTAARSLTLLAKFRVPLDLLLKHAVMHELAHSLCKERDEARTEVHAEQLLRDGVVKCRIFDF